jgi:hypothetical protein
MSSCDTPDKFNVVILYDHIASVRRAITAYLHLAHELESEFTPELRIWRIDVATSLEFAAQADDDIKAAELVIMAVRGSQPCPLEFQRWTAGAVERGCLPRHALIAIGEAAGEPARSAGTWNSVLQSAAAQIQLDVFLWTPPAAAENPGQSAPFRDAAPERAEPALEALPGVGEKT